MDLGLYYFEFYQVLSPGNSETNSATESMIMESDRSKSKSQKKKKK